MLHESFKMDVLGQPRKQPVPLPSVIKGGRPGAIPNTKVGLYEPRQDKIGLQGFQPGPTQTGCRTTEDG